MLLVLVLTVGSGNLWLLWRPNGVEHLSEPAEDRSDDSSTDVLLRSGLPEADVLYTLVDLFVAGINTVSTTLEWQLLLTAEFPKPCPYITPAVSDRLLVMRR